MDFMLRCDARARVLSVTFGKVVTDDTFLAAFAAVKDFISRHGPHHGIADFSCVESFELTNELLNQLGSMAPAIPEPMRRLVVASTPAAYVGARIVQRLRPVASAPIKIVPTIDAAYAALATSGSELSDVRSG